MQALWNGLPPRVNGACVAVGTETAAGYVCQLRLYHRYYGYLPEQGGDGMG